MGQFKKALASKKTGLQPQNAGDRNKMWCRCISQGKTRKEALANIKDAMEGYLESLKKHNDPISPSIEEEVIEVYAQILSPAYRVQEDQPARQNLRESAGGEETP